MNPKLYWRAVHSAIDHTFFELWQKWKTVVFSALPDEKKGRDKTSSTKDNVNSLKKKFETSSMKDNEAYVIMWTNKQQLPIVSILGFKFIIIAQFSSFVSIQVSTDINKSVQVIENIKKIKYQL